MANRQLILRFQIRVIAGNNAEQFFQCWHASSLFQEL